MSLNLDLHIHPSVTKTASFWSTEDIYILCVTDVQTVTDNTLPAELKHNPWRYTLHSFLHPLQAGSRGGAVCIQTCLGAGRTGVRIPAEARDVSSKRSTGSGTYPASYWMDTRVPSRGKSGRAIKSTTGVKNEWSYSSTSPIRLHGMTREDRIFYLVNTPPPKLVHERYNALEFYSECSWVESRPDTDYPQVIRYFPSAHPRKCFDSTPN
jgi:hypothetical protein